MFTLQSATRRVVLSTTARRSLTTTCQPALRLKQVIEEYRTQHFSRETPHRFKKELLKAFTAKSASPEVIQVDSLNDFFVNIGRGDDRLSEAELKLLIEDSGSSGRVIPVEQVIALM